MVDLDKLMAFLRDLELRGNLKIPRPKNMHALERLLAEYDAKGDGVTKMQKREWQAFLNDCVVDATEFTSLTVQKLARDVNDFKLNAFCANVGVLSGHSVAQLRAKAQMLQLAEEANVRMRVELTEGVDRPSI